MLLGILPVSTDDYALRARRASDRGDGRARRSIGTHRRRNQSCCLIVEALAELDLTPDDPIVKRLGSTVEPT
jgi:hypothetical protein